jgi:hypothetical protein
MLSSAGSLPGLQKSTGSLFDTQSARSTARLAVSPVVSNRASAWGDDSRIEKDAAGADLLRSQVVNSTKASIRRGSSRRSKRNGAMVRQQAADNDLRKTISKAMKGEFEVTVVDLETLLPPRLFLGYDKASKASLAPLGIPM